MYLITGTLTLFLPFDLLPCELLARLRKSFHMNITISFKLCCQAGRGSSFGQTDSGIPLRRDNLLYITA
jgi:hypothetical protein